jgi:hypothetical protein
MSAGGGVVIRFVAVAKVTAASSAAVTNCQGDLYAPGVRAARGEVIRSLRAHFDRGLAGAIGRAVAPAFLRGCASALSTPRTLGMGHCCASPSSSLKPVS